MKNGRLRIWVDPFQSRLFLRVVSYWFVYQFTLWNFLFAWRLLEVGPGDLLQQYGAFCLDYYPIMFCFLILAPAFAWDSVRFAHPLVGPLVRFRRTMQAIAAGEPVQPIKLRDGDYLVEMQDDFNAMLQALERRGLVLQAKQPENKDSSSGIPQPEVSEQTP